MAITLSATKLCKCLGDDLRLSLVCLMDVQREICVCDLVDALDAPQSTISRHLAQLRQCELVVAGRPSGEQKVFGDADPLARACRTISAKAEQVFRVGGV